MYKRQDLFGTLALADAKQGRDVLIVSCDGDLLQLTVHAGIRVYFLKRGMNDFVLYDAKEVEKKNGYPAAHITDYKGLAGDSSDNIPGVPGIGATFAKRLITTFGGLDAIYRALDSGALKQAGFTTRIETLLSARRESAFASRDLATIHTDVAIRVTHTKPWRERIVYEDALNTLETYSFTSLRARLNTITDRADTPSPKRTTPRDTARMKEAAIALWVLDASQTNARAEDV